MINGDKISRRRGKILKRRISGRMKIAKSISRERRVLSFKKAPPFSFGCSKMHTTHEAKFILSKESDFNDLTDGKKQGGNSPGEFRI